MEFDLFNMQEIWEEILERSQKSDDDKAKDFQRYLQMFPAEPKLEDFDFYRNYVSNFVLCKELCDKEFLNDLDMPTDEILLLLKFVAASFSSEYDLQYLPEEDKLELTISVQSGEQSITKKLQEIWSVQVKLLFVIYMEEQLHLDFIIAQDEDESMILSSERKERIALFNKKMAQCVFAASGDTRDIESQLDDLLNS